MPEFNTIEEIDETEDTNQEKSEVLIDEEKEIDDIEDVEEAVEEEFDIEELTKTENAQPAIMSVSIAIFRVLENEIGVDNSTGQKIVSVNPNFYRPCEVDLLIGDAKKAVCKSKNKY